MHHPREAVIDGVQFVLIREDLLEEVKNMLGTLAGHLYQEGSHGVPFQYEKIKQLYQNVGEL
jgi:hypothetical protein